MIFGTVLRLACVMGSGSGVVISEHDVLTAQHVVSGNGCPYDELVSENRERDYAVIRMEQSLGQPISPISCDGIRAGARYTYRGQRFRGSGQASPQTYTLSYSHGLRLLMGRTSAGESGGGVFNSDGQLVAIIIGMTSEGVLIRDLADTALCHES